MATLRLDRNSPRAGPRHESGFLNTPKKYYTANGMEIRAHRYQLTTRKSYRRRTRRIVLWSLPLIVAASLASGLRWYSLSVDSDIARNESETAEYEVEFQRLLPILIQRRIDREIAENEAVRDAVYARTVAGYDTPPTLTSNKCNYLKTHNNPALTDVIVNKRHCLAPLDYVPDLTTIYGATLHKSAALAYKNMIDAAKLAGHNISSSSSYRSYADQVYTYRYWVSYSGRAEADTYSAYPGYSEHQTGFAVDLQTPGCVLGCFGSDLAYNWMKRYAYRYGFIERYPDGLDDVTGYTYEPWHWRYIGKDDAREYVDSGASTLEELWDIP